MNDAPKRRKARPRIRRPAFEKLEARRMLFSPYTHVEIGKDVLTDLADNGTVSILGREYAVRAEVADAVLNQGSFFRGGLVGPDGFPDLATGQSEIHPGSAGPMPLTLTP